MREVRWSVAAKPHPWAPRDGRYDGCMTSPSVIREDRPRTSARRPWQILVLGFLCVLCFLAAVGGDARAAGSSVDQYIEKVPSAQGPRYDHYGASSPVSPAASPSGHKKATSTTTTPAGAAGGGGKGSSGAPGAGSGSGAKASPTTQVLSTPSSTKLQSDSVGSSDGLLIALIVLSIGGLASWIVGAKRRRRRGIPTEGPTT